MNRLSIYIFISLSLFSCDSQEFPTLILTDKNNVSTQSGNDVLDILTINESEGLIIDGRNYAFPSQEPPIEPDWLLIWGKRNYMAKWDNSTNYLVLDESTIMVRDSLPFNGFNSGDSLLIIIGKRKNTENYSLSALYGGKVFVR